jgi:hypothetical protein
MNLTERIKQEVNELNAGTPRKNIRDLIAYLGMSEGGFYNTWQNDRLKVATVAKNAEFYGISLTELIRSATGETMSESEV